MRKRYRPINILLYANDTTTKTNKEENRQRLQLHANTSSSMIFHAAADVENAAELFRKIRN